MTYLGQRLKMKQLQSQYFKSNPSLTKRFLFDKSAQCAVPSWRMQETDQTIKNPTFVTHYENLMKSFYELIFYFFLSAGFVYRVDVAMAIERTVLACLFTLACCEISSKLNMISVICVMAQKPRNHVDTVRLFLKVLRSKQRRF